MHQRTSGQLDDAWADEYEYERRWRERRMRDMAETLAPLIRHLEAYDALRIKLQKEGGTLADVGQITEHLNAKITIEDYRPLELTLTDGVSVRRTLRCVGEDDVYLDVRRLDTGLPVYYLCRTWGDWWSEYDLVVEDLYRSPGYTWIDARFARLMGCSGHERCFLRVSQFRAGVEAMAQSRGPTTRQETDRRLYQVGRHVLEAAWHEDQAVGLLAATHLQLAQFARAIEILYLALSGDLCELRSLPQREFIAEFFERLYPQPAIIAFLTLLADLDGAALNRLPDKALKLYTRLSKAFGQFLELQVTWGGRRVRLPLHKLVLANVTRLGTVAEELNANTVVREAAERLANIAFPPGKTMVRPSVHRPNETDRNEPEVAASAS